MLGITGPYLFLGCHMDDVEFGCGGLVAKLVESGATVQIAVLSAANKNSKGELQLIRNQAEAFQAAAHLGLSMDQLYLGRCYGQVFDQDPQQLREELLELRQRFQPEAVFYPSKGDVHQDHSTLAENAFRIFRNVNCFGYEVIRSSFSFEPTCYTEISEEHLEKKIQAILCYKSQKTESAGYYFDKQLVQAAVRFRGGQCGLPLAEAYECYRLVLR